MNYIAFDIEISKEIPEGVKDWKGLRPLGISCAATYDLSLFHPLTLWHGLVKAEYPPQDTYPLMFSPSMLPEEVCGMVDYLYRSYKSGVTIVTFNGLSFDFDVVAEECQSPEYKAKCIELAMNHVDIMFAFVCQKGFPVGLQACCKGMGLAGKKEGMHGDLAPVMWAKSRADQDIVLEYVAQDVNATGELYEAIIRENGFLKWITKKGTPGFTVFGNKHLPTVSEALKFPLPDTSWMTGSIRKREDYYAWTLQEKEQCLTELLLAH